LSTAKVVYQGDLRTEAIHLQSGTKILTDAPTDNHGKGEAFSPTDLLATALLTCAITTMGIAAQGRGWDLGGIEGTVLKVMANGPRRVARLEIEITFVDSPLDADQRGAMEDIALHCPVARSLHPDLEQHIVFRYV
jgi:putative redox protein